jgi:hypothetical protein
VLACTFCCPSSTQKPPVSISATPTDIRPHSHNHHITNSDFTAAFEFHPVFTFTIIQFLDTQLDVLLGIIATFIFCIPTSLTARDPNPLLPCCSQDHQAQSMSSMREASSHSHHIHIGSRDPTSGWMIDTCPLHDKCVGSILLNAQSAGKNTSSMSPSAMTSTRRGLSAQ